MKPYMRKWRGLWYVYTREALRRFGEGYTQEEAYRDWKRRNA